MKPWNYCLVNPYMSGRRRSRTIKLFCPALSKLVPFIALEEQKVDLGSIARAFGLDPATLRLNGHFISSGIDLISSSITWKSLLSFFSARGLTTGTDDSDALVVDGKLCKVGTKRSHNPYECNDHGIKIKQPLDDVNLKKKKIDERYSGGEDGGLERAEGNGLGVKRKSWLEETNPLKKKKPDGTNPECGGKQPDLSKAILSTQNTCSGHTSGIMKRPREEQTILSTAACKRSRYGN